MRTGPAGRLQWWQRRETVLVLALLSTVPLWWPTVPPLVDLPGHMARYRVQIDNGQTPWFADWFRFQWSLIGNLGVDLLIVPFAKLFGLELGTKLIVMTIPALTVAGLLWIAREVHGRVPPTAFFALPLAYGFPFHFGFVNFALSMALALNAFALWLRLARLGRLRQRAAVFVPLSCLLWLCHTFGWGVLGVLGFSAELIRQRDRGQGWIAAWFRAGIACLALALPLVLMVVWRSGAHVGGQTADWFNWPAKFLWLELILRDRWEMFDLLSLAAMVTLLAIGARSSRIEYSRNLGLSALFLLGVFVLLPRIVFGSAYADMRLAPFMLAVALIALRPRAAMTARQAALLAAAGLAFFGVRLIATTVSFWMFDRTYHRELVALDRVPDGARLVSFVGGTCGGPWMMTRLEHLPALALVRRRAYTNDQWSMAGAQLLTARYATARGFAHDPSQFVTPAQCPREFWRPISRSLATFPRDAFDYVWLIEPPAYDHRLEAGLVPIWRQGTSALFRIDHAQPGPAREFLLPGAR